MINRDDEVILENEMEAFKYPSDREISEVGLRGLFIGNYDIWDANAHTELVKARYG